MTTTRVNWLYSLKAELKSLNVRLSELEKIEHPTNYDLEQVWGIKRRAQEITSAIRNLERQLGYAA